MSESLTRREISDTISKIRRQELGHPIITNRDWTSDCEWPTLWSEMIDGMGLEEAWAYLWWDDVLGTARNNFRCLHFGEIFGEIVCIGWLKWKGQK